MGYATLLVILWITLSLNAFIGYAALVSELPWLDKIIVCLVFMIGGPAFGINQILTAILDLIFPEGWDDEDGTKL